MDSQNAIELPPWAGIVVIVVILALIIFVIVKNVTNKAKDFQQELQGLSKGEVQVGTYCSDKMLDLSDTFHKQRLDSNLPKCGIDQMMTGYIKDVGSNCYHRVCKYKNAPIH